MEPTPLDRRTRAREVAFVALCAVAYGWFFNFLEKVNNPNEQVRVQTVVALSDHGTWVLARRTADRHGSWSDSGPVLERFGVVHDEALACDSPAARPPACTGKLVQAKAPGLALAGVAPYLLQRTVWRVAGAGLPSRAAIVWWLRVSCVIVHTVAAWLWLARHLQRTLDRPRLGVAVVIAGALGSLSLTYGQMFAGHAPAAVALLATFAAASRAMETSEPWWVVAVGFAAAAAFALEYPAGPAAAIIVGSLLLRRRAAADVVRLAAGAALPILAIAAFHTSAFGAPWRFPYAHLEDQGFAAITGSTFGLGSPSAESILASLVSPYTGLLFWAPWMALLPVGLVAAMRRQQVVPGEASWRRRRAEASVALAVCAYYLWLQCSYAVWRGGWVVGPRHLTPAVPFAAIAIAHGLDLSPTWLRRLGAAALCVGGAMAIVATGAASSVSQGFPEQFYNPLREVVIPLLAHGWIADNLLTRAGISGPWSGAPYFLALAIAVVWMAALLAGEIVPRGARPGRVMASVACLLGAGLGAIVLWSAGPGRSSAGDRELQRLMRDWRPEHPPGARLVPVSSGSRP